MYYRCIDVCSYAVVDGLWTLSRLAEQLDFSDSKCQSCMLREGTLLHRHALCEAAGLLRLEMDNDLKCLADASGACDVARLTLSTGLVPSSTLPDMVHVP